MRKRRNKNRNHIKREKYGCESKWTEIETAREKRKG